MVVVSIEDDGKGIDPARRPGSGLGTQIVQSLVGDLQGRITWEPVDAPRHAGPVHREPAPDRLNPDESGHVGKRALEGGPSSGRRAARAARSPATVTVTGLADGGSCCGLSRRGGPARCGA